MIVFYNANRSREKCIPFIDEQILLLNNLIIYFNDNLKKIGKMYKCVYPGINKHNRFSNNIETANKEN